MGGQKAGGYEPARQKEPERERVPLHQGVVQKVHGGHDGQPQPSAQAVAGKAVREAGALRQSSDLVLEKQSRQAEDGDEGQEPQVQPWPVDPVHLHPHLQRIPHLAHALRQRRLLIHPGLHQGLLLILDVGGQLLRHQGAGFFVADLGDEGR